MKYIQSRQRQILLLLITTILLIGVFLRVANLDSKVYYGLAIEEPQHPPLYFVMVKQRVQWFGNSISLWTVTILLSSWSFLRAIRLKNNLS